MPNCCLVCLLVILAKRTKLSIGEKAISYMHGKELEEALLLYGMVERESEKGLKLRKLRAKSCELIRQSVEEFKRSDGWARKFCARNSLDIKDALSCPKFIPR